MLSQLDAGGLLGPYIAPLTARRNKRLNAGAEQTTPPKFARRIRVQAVGARTWQVPHFQAVGNALLRRQRLLVHHHGRSRNESHESEVPPQHLTHSCSNWYLEAWCHWREALHSFAVEAIQRAQVLKTAAINVPEPELDAVLGGSYGIFPGREAQWAELRFNPERARWVAAQCWHPKQRGHFEPDGSYRLDLPYADPRDKQFRTRR